MEYIQHLVFLENDNSLIRVPPKSPAHSLGLLSYPSLSLRKPIQCMWCCCKHKLKQMQAHMQAMKHTCKRCSHSTQIQMQRLPCMQCMEQYSKMAEKSRFTSFEVTQLTLLAFAMFTCKTKLKCKHRCKYGQVGLVTFSCIYFEMFCKGNITLGNILRNSSRNFVDTSCKKIVRCNIPHKGHS